MSGAIDSSLAVTTTTTTTTTKSIINQQQQQPQQHEELSTSSPSLLASSSSLALQKTIESTTIAKTTSNVNSQQLEYQPPLTHEEWESTIAIPITEDQYNNHVKNGNNFKIDLIFLFENGTRLSARVLQAKKTTYCRNLISFYQNEWYPIKRTTAIEILQPIPKELIATKTIQRFVVHQHNNIRVSYNMEECPNGVKYNVEYEIEYKKNTPYNEILQLEQLLISCVRLYNFKIKRQTLSLVDLFSCVMTKVQMWHCFDANKPYIWAYKWNGIKAKLLITDRKTINGKNLTYLWPDANNIPTEECHGEGFDVLVNFCFLVEIMDDCIVIIEAIGALIENDIYTTEPMTNAYVLKYLKTQKLNIKIGNKPVIVQEFYGTKLPSAYDTTKFDGFIIIQNDMIIKWKIPTIDVKCIDKFTYQVAEYKINLDFEGVVGKIYEISYKNEVLRQRVDRIAASSKQEYLVFRESTKHLLENKKVTID